MNPIPLDARLFDEDTSPEARRLMTEAYRRMTPAERFARVMALNALISGLALADIRSQYPDASERQCLYRLAMRRMDPELLFRLAGGMPD